MLNIFRNLSKNERQDLWPAAWRLGVARICLTGGIQRTQRWLGGMEPLPESLSAETELTAWQRRALALRRVGNRIPDTHCLARALALRWWMRSKGLDAQMRIGVRAGEDGVESHAWVEWNGVPVDETPEKITRFKLLPTTTQPSRNP